MQKKKAKKEIDFQIVLLKNGTMKNSKNSFKKKIKIITQKMIKIKLTKKVLNLLNN